MYELRLILTIISQMLHCQFCNANEMSSFLTRCCKAFICIPCKEGLQKKLSCQCGKTIQGGKKIASQNPQILQVLTKYRQGKTRECDRCEKKAEVQCFNCDMVYCSTCNQQMHAAIGFAKHQRAKMQKQASLKRIKKKEAICGTHSQSIILGCDCGIGLCTMCLKSHKQLCSKGYKTKPLKQFKQEYYLNVLLKMRQVEQYKQSLQKDGDKYSAHFQEQQSLFCQQKKLIYDQFQYLIKLMQMKFSQVKNRLGSYWSECERVYSRNLLKIKQQIEKYDEYGQLLSEFTDNLLNLDYFDKKIVRTALHFDFVNIKTIGIQQVQSSILNANIAEKAWENIIIDVQQAEQGENKNLKEQFRLLGNINNLSQQIIEYTNNPLKDRIIRVLPSHSELCFNFIHLPYQNLNYELEYGVGMKMKGQEIFKKISNSNGYGTIQGLNPSTKYRIRMRVAQGPWGPISQINTLDLPKFNLENSLCAKAVAENMIQLVKGGAVYGSNEINFGIHKWVIKMTSKSISYEDSETACMSVGVSNKQTKKAIFVGTTLNYGYQKSEIIVRVILDCYQKRMTIINSTTNKEDVYQNLPNFPLFPTLQNKGSGQINIKYNLSTDDPNLC